MLALAEREGLGWPLPEGLDERQVLWSEYREQHPEGYSYSQYCERFRRWCTRQEHEPGDKLFIDYAGQTVPVDAGGAEGPREAQTFVAVRPAYWRYRPAGAGRSA